MSVIFLIVVMRRDRAAYTSSDLQHLIDVPIILQLPHLSDTVRAQAVESAGSGRRLLR
jgi:hypothetical protein